MKSDEKRNDLRPMKYLVSGLLAQNVTWFSSVIEEGIGLTVRNISHRITRCDTSYEQTVDICNLDDGEFILFASCTYRVSVPHYFSWSVKSSSGKLQFTFANGTISTGTGPSHEFIEVNVVIGKC